MGSRWKMFTQAQGQELIDGTNSAWVTLNGVNGRMFISKKDSKYIFLPAGGHWYNTGSYNVESEGHFWTTTWLSTSGQDACLFYIYDDSVPRPVGFTSHSCSDGNSVRAIN